MNNMDNFWILFILFFVAVGFFYAIIKRLWGDILEDGLAGIVKLFGPAIIGGVFAAAITFLVWVFSSFELKVCFYAAIVGAVLGVLWNIKIRTELARLKNQPL